MNGYWSKPRLQSLPEWKPFYRMQLNLIFKDAFKYTILTIIFYCFHSYYFSFFVWVWRITCCRAFTCTIHTIKTVVPLSVLLSITIAGFIVIQDKEKIHVRSAGGLILYAIIGIPLGLVLLIHINEYIVKIFLSIIIISFSFFC